MDMRKTFRLVLEGKASNGGFAIDQLTFNPGDCPSRISVLIIGADDGHGGLRCCFPSTKSKYCLSHVDDFEKSLEYDDGHDDQD